MLVVNDKQSPPPWIGWCFFVHQTNHTSCGGDHDEMFAAILTHFHGNGLAVPDNLTEVVYAQICSRIPKNSNYCREADVEKLRASHQKHLAAIKATCGSCGGGQVR